MEEDIRILEELIEIGLEDFSDITITDRQAQAVENLITRYKAIKAQKEAINNKCKELEEENRKLIDKQDTEINKLKKEKEYYKKLYNESYNFLDPKFTGDHIPRID